MVRLLILSFVISCTTVACTVTGTIEVDHGNTVTGNEGDKSGDGDGDGDQGGDGDGDGAKGGDGDGDGAKGGDGDGDGATGGDGDGATGGDGDGDGATGGDGDGDQGGDGDGDGATGGDGDGDGGGGNEPVVGEPASLTGITAAHNKARAAKGLEPMSWDPQLAAIAQLWVDRCVFEHNNGRSNDYPGYVGENLYASGFIPNGSDVVKAWASEESDYNYDTNICTQGKACGHYTQVVWKESLRVGCAVSNCPSSPWRYIVACDYAPGGNINGRRPY